MVPWCLGTKSPRSCSKLLILYIFLTLMMAVQNGPIHDVATKVGRWTNKNWDVPPAQASSRHWTYDAIGWTNVHRISVKVKVKLCMGNFRLPSLLAYSNKSPRLILAVVGRAAYTIYSILGITPVLYFPMITAQQQCQLRHYIRYGITENSVFAKFIQYL